MKGRSAKRVAADCGEVNSGRKRPERKARRGGTGCKLRRLRVEELAELVVAEAERRQD